MVDRSGLDSLLAAAPPALGGDGGGQPLCARAEGGKGPLDQAAAPFRRLPLLLSLAASPPSPSGGGVLKTAGAETGTTGHFVQARAGGEAPGQGMDRQKEKGPRVPLVV